MNRKSTVSTLIVLAGMLALPVQAHESNRSHSYWYDSQGNVVRSMSGSCLRTNYWSAEDGLEECGTGMKKAMPAKEMPAKAMAPADSDNDGVVDSKDQCPGTASGMMVDSKGCTKDSDNDGVADSNDKCPGTASGIAVNASGCALSTDADGDGIADANDDCPNTAKGIAVNTRGCELKEDIRLENVQFKTGTAELDANSRNILNRIAGVLKDNTHLKFQVSGHTDSSGAVSNNVKLSEARANSVRQYLIDQGVAANRLEAVGFGPNRPVASNDTLEGRRMNRRVELNLQ